MFKLDPLYSGFSMTGDELEMVISRYMLQDLRGRGDRFETSGVLRSPWYAVIPLDLRQDGNFEGHVYVVCVHVCLHVWEHMMLGDIGYLPQLCSTLFMEARSLSELSTHCLGHSGSQPAVGIPGLHFIGALGFQVGCHTHCFM